MIILSNGMFKSGSSVFSWVQKEILMLAFPVNGQNSLEKQIYDKVIPGKRHFVFNLSNKNILNTLLHIKINNGPFLVKSHTEATFEIINLIRKGFIISTFTHRDPRDIILSAIDHGKRDIANRKEDSYFKRFSDIETSIPLVKESCHIALNWLESGLIAPFSYSDIVTDPKKEIMKFCRLIKYTPDESTINNLVYKYFKNPVKGLRQFNKGKATRYIEEMSEREIGLCNDLLKEEITLLGYTI